MANYLFTQPIRYYKANDPYYYEVDNIPLRQLEQNILYIKSLVEGTGGDPGEGGGDAGSGGGNGTLLTSNSELDITKIKQLRPKPLGGRTVQVNAGVFTARINDAFDIADPLTKLTITSPTTGAMVIPQLTQVWTSDLRDTVWNAFVGSEAASNAYNVNGLETTYTFYSTPGGVGENWGWTTAGTENYPKYAGISPNHRWPGFSNFGPLAGQNSITSSNSIIDYTFDNLPSIHMAFVKMWRGVFRTSVVDFPQSTIEVPAWDDADFYYTDSAGAKININADQRIDLLVAYSMPIDASSTTLQDYQSGFCNTGTAITAKKVTQPVLGLFRGAGIGIGKDDGSDPVLVSTLEGCNDPGTPGSARMVGNVSDKAVNANYGITTSTGAKIHGSFPSPDDLLNLAPVLGLNVDIEDLQLIGQSVLPIAYIVTTKGSSEIVEANIIDIRPFLRTAELTYNERAGVAAANPPLSLANPAVGAFQLQNAITAVQAGSGGGGSGSGGGGPTADQMDGKALYTDYVMGGLAYGVEGTLLSMCDGPQGTNDPFGSVTQGTTYIDPYDATQQYDFTVYPDSKSFLEDTNTVRREAYLQYVYNTRQGDLKRWISDPNSPFINNTLTYLGLPQGSTGRNIPLFPEWDMPMDGTNYTTLMAGSTADSVPKVSWWMWFEAISTQRSLAYVPGGVASPQTTETGSYLDALYMFGSGNENADAFLNICSKRLEITFPDWVSDYDVLVEYVNCGPVGSFKQGTNSGDQATVGLGSGLSVNKGPVVTGAGGQRRAVFQINSTADNLAGTNEAPATGGGTGDTTSEDGVIQDKVAGGPNASPPSKANTPFQFLSYAVALPQFRNTKWATGTQLTPIDTTMRFTPKVGAAYYPTIKFTIIGYKDQSVGKNVDYTATNNFTLLQNVSQGNAGNLTMTANGGIGPLMVNTTGQSVNSTIDIRNS